MRLGSGKHGSVVSQRGDVSSPVSEVEVRRMWTYSDGDRTVRAYRAPDGTAQAGSWVLVDEATGNITGAVGAGEFSRRFHPVDVFADVTSFPTYLGTVSTPDGTALVDLVLDRNPFMLANGPRRAARPHALIVPRSHREGWSSATAQELAARRTAMTLVAAWYRSLDGGHVVFCANDSPPNLGYLRDLEGRTGASPAVSRNPRQEVQHAHLHAFYAEDDETENHESSAPALGQRVFTEDLDGDAVRVDSDGAEFAAGARAAAHPWGGSYCSYQLGLDGPCWVMPALGRSQDEFNQRLAQADGLQAAPDPKLGGAVNLKRPSLDDPARREAAERATAQFRDSFGTFATSRGLNPPSLG
jgi:hypothetical protein